MEIHPRSKILILSFVLLFTVACEPKNPAAQTPETSQPDVAVVTSEQRAIRQFFVTDSVPVLPGTQIEIYDSVSKKILVESAIPAHVSWKVEGPLFKPEFPAFGKVAVALTEVEWAAVSNSGAPAIRPVESDTE